MSADYYLYTEHKRKDGAWHVLNGKYYNEKSDQYEIGETFHSGSRTYFSQTFRKLQEIGISIDISTVSVEVQEKENWIEPGDSVIAVSLAELRKVLPRTTRHECCGYVYKGHIWNYEVENEEIDEWLSAEEYNELSDAEKKEYEFFEWDDPMGWYSHIKAIVDIVNRQVKAYMEVNNLWEEPTDIRIVCLASY